jgi:hypothetical protein
LGLSFGPGAAFGDEGPAHDPRSGRVAGGSKGLERRLSRRTPPLKVGDLQVMGALDRQIIRRVILRRIPQLRSCQTLGRGQRSKRTAKVVIRLTIADGSVVRATVKTSTLRSPSVEKCLIEEIETLRFPGKGIPGILLVTLPLSLGVEGVR